MTNSGMRDLIKNIGIQITGMVLPTLGLSLIFGFFDAFKWWAVGGLAVGGTFIFLGSAGRRPTHRRGARP